MLYNDDSHDNVDYNNNDDMWKNMEIMWQLCHIKNNTCLYEETAHKI